MRRAISTICYIGGGFFAYAVGLLSFLNTAALPTPSKPSAWVKWVILGSFGVPGVLALVGGMALDRFQSWRWKIGIVLVSAAGVVAFAGLTMLCIFFSADLPKWFPANTLAVFSDFSAGLSCLLAFSIGGAVLILISREAKSNHPLQPMPPSRRG